MLLAVVDVHFTMPSLCCKVLLRLVSALLQVSVLAFLTGYCCCVLQCCCCVLQGTILAFLTRTVAVRCRVRDYRVVLLYVAWYRPCLSDRVLLLRVAVLLLRVAAYRPCLSDRVLLLCVAGYRRCFSDSVLIVAVCCRVRD